MLAANPTDTFIFFKWSRVPVQKHRLVSIRQTRLRLGAASTGEDAAAQHVLHARVFHMQQKYGGYVSIAMLPEREHG